MFKKLLLIFLVSKVVFFSFAMIGKSYYPERYGFLARQEYPQVSENITMWANLDGRHFLDIAEYGYRKSNFAFFPLYPWLIRYFSDLSTLSMPLIGILISLVSQFVALIFLYKLVRLDFDEKNTWWTLIFASFYSFSYYYQSVYADSLFFLFIVLSFYNARKNNWIAGGIFGALAILTRLSGVALIPALFVEWLIYAKRISFKTMLLTLAITSFGLIYYMIYQYHFFGDAFIFQKSMSAWSQDKFVFPLQVVWRYFRIFVTVKNHDLIYWEAVLEFVTIILYFFLTWVTFKKIRISYSVFMFFLLILVPITGTFAGNPRYLLHLFSGFMAFTVLTKTNQQRYILLLAMLIFGLIYTTLFTRGYFIT